MNKFLLTLAALATTAVASAQQLYSTDFATEEEFNKWTVLDVNADGSTWMFSESGSQSHVYYNYSPTNNADDWFVSPAIVPTVTGKLMIKYTTYGSSYGESFEVFTGNQPEVASLTALQGKYDRVVGAHTTNYFLYDATADVPFYIGFHCTSQADKFRLFMCNFSVQAVNKIVDLRAESLLSPVGGNDLGAEEEVKVRIVNDGEETSDAFKVAYQIDGGEPVVEDVDATLAPGAQMEYTFKTKADLSTPRHNYTIKTYPIEANDVNNDNDALSVVVRHDGALVAPCSWGFEASEDNAQIKYIDANEDGYDFSPFTDPWLNFARTGNYCLAYFYNKEKAADDWVVLDPINVEAGSYVLRYWYSGTVGHTEKFGVYYGNGDTPSDLMAHNVAEIEAKQGEYQEAFHIITFDKPQTINLAFHCHSDKDENVLSIDDVQFYKASSDNVDIMPSNLAKPFDYARTPNDKDVVFDISNVGIKDADCKVSILVDGAEVFTSNYSLVAQEIKTITAKNALNGISEGKHSLQIIVKSELDNNADNDAISKDFVMLGAPMKLYDFEDNKLPEDFTFYVNDEGTVNPDAGDEFNAEGWGLFELEKHAMYGEHLLAGTTWIDGATPDRWAILPQVKVTGDNAYFVWDANSFNRTLLEDYNVKVSDGSGNPADWWYTTELKVTKESITPKSRGIDLSKYKGNDVYIAFNLVSAKGEVLCLDNIGLYGDVVFTGNKFDAGVKDIKNDADGIIVDNNKITAVGATAVNVVDLAGRTVVSAADSSADVTSLNSGVYIAVVKYANGTSKSVKFIKK